MADAQGTEIVRQFGQVVAKAWSDESFKRRLMADPNAVLREQGLSLPPGVEFKIVENSSNVVYLPLPATPGEPLSDEQLEQVAGGSTASTAGSGGSIACICGTASSAFSAGTAGTA